MALKEIGKEILKIKPVKKKVSEIGEKIKKSLEAKGVCWTSSQKEKQSWLSRYAGQIKSRLCRQKSRHR